MAGQRSSRRSRERRAISIVALAIIGGLCVGSAAAEAVGTVSYASGVLTFTGTGAGDSTWVEYAGTDPTERASAGNPARWPPGWGDLGPSQLRRMVFVCLLG